MAKPSPKNRNHDLVLQIPSRVCFRTGGGASPEVTGKARDGELARVRVREDMERAPVWMIASLLKKEEEILGLGFRGGVFREDEGRR